MLLEVTPLLGGEGLAGKEVGGDELETADMLAGRLAMVATVTGTDTGVVANGTAADGMVATTVEGVGGVVAGLMVVVATRMAATVVTARKTGIGRV